MLLTNTLVDIYKRRDLEWDNGEMTNLKSFLEEQIKDKEIELSNIENDLKKFQEDEKIFSLDENSRLLLEQLTNIEVQYNNVSLDFSFPYN